MNTNKELIPKRRFKEFKNCKDWEQRKLTEAASLFGGLTYSPNNIVRENGTLVLRSSNVKNGEVVDADNVYVDSEVINVDNVRVGDIIIVVRNGSRSLIGKHGQVKAPNNNTVIGAFMSGLRSEHPEFINALLDTKLFKEKIDKNLGATINQITNSMFHQMNFLMPGFKEQDEIGQFFKNIDALITLYQRKLEKLKETKSAYLSDMFPKEGEKYPELRFEGFTEPWEERKLGEIGETYTGLSGKTKEDFGHGEAEFVTYMNVFSNSISDVEQTENVEIDEKQNEIQYGDVFFTTSSETPEDVGMSSVWFGNKPNVYLNSFCFGYRPIVKSNPYYMAYMLRSTEVRKEFQILAQGISRYNISKIKVMEIPIFLPNREEQEQIGKFFHNLDSLITLHQRKLSKFKNLKKAYLNEMFV